MKNIEIKQVHSDLAETIVTIHYDAVHNGTASGFYSQEILNAWSPPATEERIGSLAQKMDESRPLALLAYMDNIPAGFGILDHDQARIGAIYVKASFTGLHIGHRLLQRLEQAACTNGHEKLHLDASLNAKAFYEKSGYSVLSEGFFTLPAGKQMQSVLMSKTLTGR